MAKPTEVSTSYRLQDNRVTITSFFLYEVSVYKIEPNCVSILGSKFYKSDSLLNIKKETTEKKFKNYSIVKFVDLLGVPESFVKENNLPIWEPKRKKRNERKSRIPNK